jgi:hypothetical protein
MRTSTRVGSFTESVIRETTRLAMAHDAEQSSSEVSLALEGRFRRWRWPLTRLHDGGDHTLMCARPQPAAT